MLPSAFIYVWMAAKGPDAPPPKPKEPVPAPATEDGDLSPPRDVPVHPLTVFADCPDDQLGFAVGSLANAIELGAPRYNQGDHVGCYRIYLGTATDLVSTLPGCAGVRAALVAGIVRASVLQTYTERAWAMRDAFDGLLEAYQRRKPPTP
jgi:serine protease Do